MKFIVTIQQQLEVTIDKPEHLHSLLKSHLKSKPAVYQFGAGLQGNYEIKTVSNSTSIVEIKEDI